MSLYRLVWVKCYDCGRHGLNGGCITVQKKGWLFWRDYLATYNRGGSQMAEHYPSEGRALEALQAKHELEATPERRIMRTFYFP